MQNDLNSFFESNTAWKEEVNLLRSLVIDCLLSEELKWNQPCYTHKSKNVALISRFKNYCALSFFKGVLLHDELGILQAPGENSQTVRLIKFTSVEQIEKAKGTIKAYLIEAVENEKQGIKTPLKNKDALEIPKELSDEFKENPSLKIAFESLTPGRQRGYVLFITSAKQVKTKIARIKKYKQQILNGKGINDCTCGYSKKMPNCDGSHKHTPN